MTREDIIRMAREAGYGDAMSDLHASALERFAALVAAHEREECARIVESVNNYDNPMTANDCATAIRARGKK